MDEPISIKKTDTHRSKSENSLLDKALDFIVEREKEDDYICVQMLESDEYEYCENNCQNLNKQCVIKFLKTLWKQPK